MTDNSAEKPLHTAPSRGIAQIVAETEPMGDLLQLLIEDLTPDEEDVFYEVLKRA